MSKRIVKSSRSARGRFGGQHRFEHWYVDNQVYFITGRCRDRYPAFASDDAKEVFWNRFDHYTHGCSFVPFVTSLLDNHYHTLGYLERGESLKRMMQRLHGSVAKLVNDLLTERRLPFWRDTKGREYFDGCIRDELQFQRAYRYTLMQAKRHELCDNPIKYPHTRISMPFTEAIEFALRREAFMPEVPYPRYASTRAGDTARPA